MHYTVLQEWEYFLGMIVSDSLRKRESLQQMKEPLPYWCNPEQTQQLNMLKVNIHNTQSSQYLI